MSLLPAHPVVHQLTPDHPIRTCVPDSFLDEVAGEGRNEDEEEEGNGVPRGDGSAAVKEEPLVVDAQADQVGSHMDHGIHAYLHQATGPTA